MSTNSHLKRIGRSRSLNKYKAASPQKTTIPPLFSKVPVCPAKPSTGRSRRCLEILDRLIAKHTNVKSDLQYIKEVFLQAAGEVESDDTRQFRTNTRRNDKADQGNRKRHRRVKTDLYIGDLTQMRGARNFQEEFMSKADEFSDSWRQAIKHQKL